ncbi:MAG: hypothetical protein ABH826_04530 [Patescibacteria group bacterium]
MNGRLPKRKSIRLPHYDYAQPGMYFVTLVTENRIHHFGRVVGADPCVCPIAQTNQDPCVCPIAQINQDPCVCPIETAYENDSHIQLSLGYCYFQIGKMHEAKEHYKKFLLLSKKKDEEKDRKKVLEFLSKIKKK